MNDIRNFINLLERKAYRIQSNGQMVNSNIDRSEPKIQVTNKDGDVFDLHGKSEEFLKDYISKKNGWEVFEPGKGEASKGGNEELDAIVKKYAKPGMTLDDLAAMEKEADGDFESRYVLAHAAQTLGLEGLYRSDGSGFVYLKDGKPAGARGANLTQSQDLAEIGLLPSVVADKIQKVADRNKETDPAKAEKFQKVVDAAKSEEPAGAKQTTNQRLEDARKKYKRFIELLTKAMEDVPSGKPGDTGPNESWQPKSYADILLAEALAADELEELEQLYNELNTIADGDPFDDDLDDQISDAINRYDMWKAGNADQAKQDDAQDNQADATVDYSSDEQIKKATDDVEAWIANEMPKELESKQAKGLLKATNRGKIKSASAAAVQTILMRIGTANNNDDLKKIKADGLYGPATVRGVKRAQEIAGITVDGDAGANTAKELLDYSKNPQGAIDDAMKSDFARIEELIAKHEGEESPAGAKGDNQEGKESQNWGDTSFDNYAKDVAKQAGIEVQSKQFDIRSMLETLSRLDEALSLDEYKELRALLDKHRSKFEDPEVAQQYSQYADIFKKADAIKSPEDPAGAAKIDSPDDIEWTGDADAFAAQLLKAGESKFFGTDEAAMFDVLGRIPNRQAYDAVDKAFGNISKFASVKQSIEDEMNLVDRMKYVFPHFRRLGIEHNIAPSFIRAQGGLEKINADIKGGAYNEAGDWVPGEAAAGGKPQTGGGKSGYEYVGSTQRNGTAPVEEQNQDKDFVIAYWDGQKYFISTSPDGTGKYKGSTTRGRANAEVRELMPAVRVEIERRKKEGVTPTPAKATPDPAVQSGAGPEVTDVMASKDYSMKKTMNESASMNISMSGDNAGEVGELLKILKNAGMENAAPVGAIDMPMDTEVPSSMEPDMMGPMPCATCGGDHGDDTPCGGSKGWDNAPDEDHGELSDIIKLSGGPNSNKNPGDIRIKDPSPYEDVEEEDDGWDNSPDEEYKDDDHMYQSGGIHKKKKAYAKAQDGDNAMAVESIKDQLYKALKEKLQNK